MISEETREKLRKAKGGKNHPFYGKTGTMLGKKLSDESKEKIRQYRLGKKLSKETKKKLSIALSGEGNPNYGKKMSDNQLEKISGEKSTHWRGDQVGYNGVHTWARKNLPKPKLCQICNKVPPYDLANISGKYLRDLSDWQYLCRRCHMLSDGRLDRLHRKTLNRKKL